MGTKKRILEADEIIMFSAKPFIKRENISISSKFLGLSFEGIKISIPIENLPKKMQTIMKNKSFSKAAKVDEIVRLSNKMFEKTVNITVKKA